MLPPLWPAFSYLCISRRTPIDEVPFVRQGSLNKLMQPLFVLSSAKSLRYGNSLKLSLKLRLREGLGLTLRTLQA
jgi:hypothetical protein